MRKQLSIPKHVIVDVERPIVKSQAVLGGFYGTQFCVHNLHHIEAAGS
jgi:hypothetical protein